MSEFILLLFEDGGANRWFITAVLTLIGALLGGVGKSWYDARVASKNRQVEDRRESDKSFAELRRLELEQEEKKRNEIETAAREIREYLAARVDKLNSAFDEIEKARKQEKAEHEKTAEELARLRLEHTLFKATAEETLRGRDERLREAEGMLADVRGDLITAREERARACRQFDNAMLTLNQYRLKYGDLDYLSESD